MVTEITLGITILALLVERYLRENQYRSQLKDMTRALLAKNTDELVQAEFIDKIQPTPEKEREDLVSPGMLDEEEFDKFIESENGK